VLAIIRSRPKRTQPRHDLVPAVEHRVQVTTPSPPSRVCVKNVAEAHSLPDVVDQNQGLVKVVQNQGRNLVVQNHSSLANPAPCRPGRWCQTSMNGPSPAIPAGGEVRAWGGPEAGGLVWGRGQAPPKVDSGGERRPGRGGVQSSAHAGKTSSNRRRSSVALR